MKLLGRGVGASEGHLAVSDDLAQVDNVPVFQQQRGRSENKEPTGGLILKMLNSPNAPIHVGKQPPCHTSLLSPR